MLVLARLLVSSPLAGQLRLRVTRVLVQTVPAGGGVGGHADDGGAGGLARTVLGGLGARLGVGRPRHQTVVLIQLHVLDWLIVWSQF